MEALKAQIRAMEQHIAHLTHQNQLLQASQMQQSATMQHIINIMSHLGITDDILQQPIVPVENSMGLFALILHCRTPSSTVALQM